MELANPRNAGGAIALQALGAYLLQQFRDVADQRIQGAAENIITRIEQGGHAAGLAIRNQVARLAQEAGQSVEDAWGELNDRITTAIEEHWHNNNGEITVDEWFLEEIGDQDITDMVNNAEAEVLAGLGGPEEPLDGEETTLDDLQPGEEDEEMDQGGEEPPPQAAAARAQAGGGGNNPVSKETPISNYPSLSYGLQETHTTILPWTGWLSAACLDKNEPLQLKIRLNTPYDMLDMTTGTTPADAALYTSKAFYATPVDMQGKYSSGGTGLFPVQFGSNATTAHERPAWRDHWTRQYEQYTVLGCEWEVIMHNPITSKNVRMMKVPARTISGKDFPAVLVPVDHGYYNTDVVVAEQYDVYSDTATSTGNVMPLTTYEEIRAFKNIKWHSVPGGRKSIIRGKYKPGQVKRNIVNDGDVKTWSKTDGVALPTLKEYLTLNFFCDPFFNARGNDVFDSDTSIAMDTTGSNIKGAVNMEVKLKYIVQYKDLRIQCRYPNSTTGTATVINYSTSIGDAGNPMQSWTTATAAL